MFRRLAAAFCAALALPAAMAQAQTIPSDEPPGPLAQVLPSPDLVAKLVQFNEFERQEGRLASVRARSSAVRRLANAMVRDHSRSAQVLAKAVERSGLPSPMATGLDLGQHQRLEQLKAATDSDFDRLYIDQQVRAHEAALAELSAYARNGDPGPVRQAAVTMKVEVAHHLSEFRTLH